MSTDAKALQDLEKAKWYLEREIQLRKCVIEAQKKAEEEKK